MGSYLWVNLLGPGPRLIKKKALSGRGLTKVEKQWVIGCRASGLPLSFALVSYYSN